MWERYHIKCIFNFYTKVAKFNENNEKKYWNYYG